MKILICFDLPVQGRGTISGHAVHEVSALTESELQRVCQEQRMAIQRELARSAAVQQQAVPLSTELILISVCPLAEESKIVTLR